MQRHTQPTGICLSAQKAHTKHSDSCWMRTDVHKQQSEKPSLHCFQTISIQLTRQPGRRTLGTYKRVCCVCLLPESGRVYLPQRKGAWRCGEEGWEEGPQPRSGPQRQQHLFRGWSAKRLAFLQQQGQWGGMRRRCHNQMQASWPSPRKGRHLLHLPKALFSKPQRTKWLRRRAREGGENWL